MAEKSISPPASILITDLLIIKKKITLNAIVLIYDYQTGESITENVINKKFSSQCASELENVHHPNYI